MPSDELVFLCGGETHVDLSRHLETLHYTSKCGRNSNCRLQESIGCPENFGQAVEPIQ